MSATEEKKPEGYMDVESFPGAGGDARAEEEQTLTLEERVAALEAKMAEENDCMVGYRKFSYVWASALLIFALAVVLYGIGKEWNNPPWKGKESHPALEIIVFLLMLFWIFMLEACQISIVGLQSVDMELYKDSHKRAYRMCKWLHSGPNVERFLVGRQFLLLFNGFLASRVGGAAYEDFYMGDWEWDDWAVQFFWLNSVLLLIVIVAFAQLPGQLMAADKMLGFFDLPHGAHWIVVWPCMVVEFIGVTHSSYFLKDILTKLPGIDLSEEDPEKQIDKNWFHWLRVLFSIFMVIVSCTFIIKGLALGQTNATTGPGWENLPPAVAIILFILFTFVMACAEGLQVSALVLAKRPLSELKTTAPAAYRNCKLLFKGRNLQAFLVGRQFVLALQMVLLARVTSYSGSEGEIDGNDWGAPRWFNEWLLQAGFMGAIFVVNVGQLASQVLASIFPVGFCNNFLMYLLLLLTLFIEATGIVNACWPLAWGLARLFKIPRDPFDVDADSLGKGILDRKKSLGLAIGEDDQDGAFDKEGKNNVSYI